MRLVLGARGSALSLRQTEWVCQQLRARAPGCEIDVLPIPAKADRQPQASLEALGGGEGIFVKELQDALLRRQIDVAVHSLKDVPLAEPAGLTIGAIPSREEARDALVSRSGQGFRQLPPQARVGTSSPRRRSQLLAARKDLVMQDIRGNVDTRLRKLDEGQYDAIVLAACGLRRLGLESRITEVLSCDVMLPEPGQGALALEVRCEHAAAREIIGAVEDATTRVCVDAERAFLQALGGGCRVPIAAYATLAQERLTLDGAVIALDGSRTIRGQASGSVKEAKEIARSLAKQIERDGGLELLR